MFGFTSAELELTLSPVDQQWGRREPLCVVVAASWGWSDVDAAVCLGQSGVLASVLLVHLKPTEAGRS